MWVKLLVLFLSGLPSAWLRLGTNTSVRRAKPAKVFLNGICIAVQVI
jgi:hypothetical protein